MQLRTKLQSVLYRTSFRFRLIMALLLLAVFSASIMTSFCCYILQENTISQAEAYYGHIAAQISSSLTAQADQLVFSLSNIANNKALLVAFQNTMTTPYQRYSNYKYIIDPAISSLIVNNKTIKNLTFYTSNPLLVPRGTSTLTFETLIEEPWFPDILNGDLVWHAAANSTVFSIAVCLPSIYNKNISTVVDMQIDTNLFFDQFVNILSPVMLYVQDQEGRIIYTKNDTNGICESLPAADNCSMEVGGITYHTFSSPVDTAGWQVVLAVPESEYLPNLRQVLVTVMPIVVLCIVLSILLSHVLANSLSRRIVNLSRQIESVSQGNMNCTFETPYRDEIGVLTRQLNEMVIALRQNMENLKAAERKEIEAESAALRAQINPHFLYNALSVISWKAIELGAPEVSQSISALSKFFRTVLNRGEIESSLREELNNVDSYLSIQQEMLSDSFEFRIDIPENLLDCIIPNFILQPLVENAVLHGIDRTSETPGIIQIAASCDSDTLLLYVSNTGKAFLKEELETILSTKRRGYGLRNVQERVVHLCGADYGLSIIEPHPPFSTCIQLKVKVKTQHFEHHSLT